MNQNNIVSAPGAVDLTGKEYYTVKLTATGVDLCDSASAPIGTLIRATPHQEDGIYAGKAVSVQLKSASIHFVTIGASSAAVTRGDTLVVDGSNPGQLIPGSSSPVAVAWDSFTAAQGAQVRALFLSAGIGATGATGASGYSGTSGKSGYSGYSG